MDTTRASPVRFESLPWALLLIWWGFLELLPAPPRGVGAIGVAVILLGVNALRAACGGAVSRLSIILGILALVAGSLSILEVVFEPDFEAPTLPILLIVWGAIILAGEIAAARGRGARLTSRPGGPDPAAPREAGHARTP